MDAAIIQPRNGRSRKSENIIYEPTTEARIIAEIKDMIRIRLSDAAEFRRSYQEWVKQWE